MTSINKIDNLFKQLSDNTDKLSVILPQLYPIALECKDFSGYCLLYYWGTPLGECKSANKQYFQSAKKMLRSIGLHEEEIDKIIRVAAEEYLSMRLIHEIKDQVSVLSARELEDSFARFNEMLSAVEPPSGLHPVDLYFKNEASTEQKLMILQRKQIFEKQYAILQNLITTKLIEYHTALQKEENKIEVENDITNSKNIFIIHGHSEAKRRELETVLKERFGLAPVVLSEKPSQGKTIIEKFEYYASTCSYAFAIFTPDDIITDDHGKQYLQARPNVIFELGWFYARLGRSRVCILDQESEKSIIFSDLQGVMRVQFKNNITERLAEIELELKSVGII